MATYLKLRELIVLILFLFLSAGFACITDTDMKKKTYITDKPILKYKINKDDNIKLMWNKVNDTDYYKILVNVKPDTGFHQLGEAILNDKYVYTVTPNTKSAIYIVQSCNNIYCNTSNAIHFKNLFEPDAD